MFKRTSRPASDLAASKIDFENAMRARPYPSAGRHYCRWRYHADAARPSNLWL